MSQSVTTPVRARINSIDILRGFVMIIMALDHVRDFFHKTVVDGGSSVATGPTDLDTTTPVLFFTRWITHFCAPIFVFLAGVSIYLMLLKKSKKEVAAFLIKRGIWLIVLEMVIITFGWTFNPFFNIIILQVIWAIGISMVIMGLVIRLPFKILMALGFLIVFGHNIFDTFSLNDALKGNTLYELTFHANFYVIPFAPQHIIMVIYSFIPWLGIMILGFGLGKLFAPEFDPQRRQKMLLIIGGCLWLLFLVLRLINVYGDPVPWSIQPRGNVFSFLSFINVNKYPPSLDFFSITIGGGMFLLWLFEKVQGRLTEFFRVYGRVPMFYYVLHFYLIHLLVIGLFYIQGYTNNKIVDSKSPFLFRPSTFGVPLWGVYVLWIIVVLALYPLCRRYDKYKTRYGKVKWWLGYL